MTQAYGHYYAAGQSAAVKAYAREDTDGKICIYCVENGELLRESGSDDYQIGMILANVPVEVQFSDGALFEPDDNNFRWRAIENSKESLIAKLEVHWGMVALASVVIPVFMWWGIFIAIPDAAEAAVDVFPEVVFEQAEKQTLIIMEKTLLDDSTLPAESQNRLREIWNQSLLELSLSPEKYHLLFRESDKLGPNAFALPNGTVVITDALVELLEDKQDALLAVMLHEIGHVEHQHGMKMVARSAAVSIFFALLLGDIDGAGEYIIGASSSLLDSAFSRDMEREADSYAIEKLKALNKSPDAFSEAMKGLLSASEENGGNSDSLLKYLSSHPSTLERIQAAEDAAE